MHRSLAVGTALASVTLALGLATAPVHAAAQDVSCDTGVSESDDLEGYAGCTNNTAGPIEFRVEIVCGLAPDVTGDWVRLEPGQSNQSVAHCAIYSSGPGEVRAVHRAA
ncbi:hypothetical protein [Streptomyces sp. NPDC050704]|uniref:hypothetical protein n=1 Tax=Streptomyces sp. NPDC050704 TaxID=3157219 RepID=UPI00344A0AC4